MPSQSAADAAKAAPQAIGFNLGAIVLVVGLAGVALAYGIDAASRSVEQPVHRTDTTTTLTRMIGDRELTIPLAWFRYAEQTVEGFARQIDLHFTLPLGPEGAARQVEVTLLPRSSVRPSSKLLDGVYLHMFQAEDLSGPVGLIGTPLQATEGYEGEVVWYDPISADPFVAKCSPPIEGGQTTQCLRAVHLAPGIAAVYAFGADLLPQWRNFDAEMQKRLETIGVF